MKEYKIIKIKEEVNLINKYIEIYKNNAKEKKMSDADIECALKILDCNYKYDSFYPTSQKLIPIHFNEEDTAETKNKKIEKFADQNNRTIQKVMSQFYTKEQIDVLNGLFFYIENLRILGCVDQENSCIIEDKEYDSYEVLEIYSEENTMKIDCVYEIDEIDKTIKMKKFEELSENEKDYYSNILKEYN